MNASDVFTVLREAMVVTLKVGGPLMGVALAIGLLVSLFQTLTQMQEMTLTFVPKIVVIFAALLVLMPFMLTTMVEFTQTLAERIIALGTG